jgi:tRNA 5-methylaminomethyl-2-thiouridine biosynthesis bifunctional protein
VYLFGNDCPNRWATQGTGLFHIGELGFGSGLNFLCTLQAWLAAPEPKPNLHFSSVELHPLPTRDLKRTLEFWPELTNLANQLTAQYPPPVPGVHRLLFAEGRVKLDLWFGDVEWATEQWHQQGLDIDAWYLDGFAPDRNDAMWSDAVLSRVARLSKPGCTASTFSVAAKIKNPLKALGFEISKRPGFGRKREQLFALKKAPKAPYEWHLTPWHMVTPIKLAPQKIAVVGAGLAGAFTAAALAQRGIEVDVYDPDGIASHASGNAQGVIYARIPKRHAPLGDFGITAFLYAINLYQDLFTSGRLTQGLDGDLSGVFHTFDTSALTELERQLDGLSELARVVEPSTVEQIAGHETRDQMLHFPTAGWMSPRALCQALLHHPKITVRDSRVTQIKPLTEGVNLCQEGANAAQEQAVFYDHVILASGTQLNALLGNNELPVKAIRGQTTQIPAIPTLSSSFCHDGYIAPAVNGEHCIGATFELDVQHNEPTQEGNEQNGSKLAHFLGIPAPKAIGQRVAFRCATPDYMPIVGPIVDADAARDTFDVLQFDARKVVTADTPVLPNLSCLTGLGSRGLTYGPLAAEILASQIAGEPLPVTTEIARGLSPARFVIRNIVRRA